MQQPKTRPSRAARARLKTRTPNIPEFTGPEYYDRPAPLPSAAVPAGAGAAALSTFRVPTSAFSRAARSTVGDVSQDYGYLRADLWRIFYTSTLLLVLMLGYAAWYHFG